MVYQPVLNNKHSMSLSFAFVVAQKYYYLGFAIIVTRYVFNKGLTSLVFKFVFYLVFIVVRNVYSF